MAGDFVKKSLFGWLSSKIQKPFDSGKEKASSDTVGYDALGFVLITDLIPDAILEIRYYSTFNFVGERIDSYEAPVAYLTREAADALKKVSGELLMQGYRIKIYDAYRPQSAVNHFIEWAKKINDTKMQPYFYPDVDKRKLFEEGYIAARSSHSRGSTIDLTLVDMKTGQEIDMGGGFDYFGELSHPDYTGELTPEQTKNRATLRDVMIKNGFCPIDTEWWHFTLKDEPYPDTYFDFPITMPKQ
ncbi:MAG: M15 family metallopeptidase [Oscillospiraceae bacterium]|nr:M15 family metallopeptidase [Oscillospiraceae bacterium]